MMLRSLIVRAGCTSGIRACYRRVQHVPILGGIAQAILRRTVPIDFHVWAPVLDGDAKGLWMWVNPRYDKPYLDGYHEIDVQRQLRQDLRNGDVFYDVGAHTGFFSMLAARLIGGGGEVFAFEADPLNSARLQHQLDRNNIHCVTRVTAAVWCTHGKITFETAPEGARMCGAVSHSCSQNPNGIEVNAITLDQWAANHRPPTLLKIDVEGAEDSVLQGAQRVCEDVRPIIICEVHSGLKAERVVEFLRGRQYSVEYLPRQNKDFPRQLVAKPLIRTSTA